LLPPDWRRERAVAKVPAGGQARLHVRFERTGPVRDENLNQTVGLDDMQLLPLLSRTSVHAGGALEALVAVPLRAELSAVDLAHLLRGASSSWERVHATAALDLGGAGRSSCAYALSFSYEDANGGSVRALPIGCALLASSVHARGAWSQCMLELPAIALDDARLRVGVVPEASSLSSSSWSSSSSSSAACALETTDSVLVFLDAYAALFECAGDSSWQAGLRRERTGPRGSAHRAGKRVCRGSHRQGSPRACKQRLRSAFAGCPALTARPDQSMCRNCTEPEVKVGRARFEDVGTCEEELDDAEPRKWPCHVEYFELGEGRGRRCAVCGEPLLCNAGLLYWKNCSRTENSMCDVCPDLLLRNTTEGAAGEYASNKEYVEASGQMPAADVEEATVEHARGPGQAAGGESCVGGRHVTDVIICRDAHLPLVMQERDVSARGLEL
jgi:hypothetical protein